MELLRALDGSKLTKDYFNHVEKTGPMDYPQQMDPRMNIESWISPRGALFRDAGKQLCLANHQSHAQNN